MVVPRHLLPKVHAPQTLRERKLDAPLAHERTLTGDEIAAKEALSFVGIVPVLGESETWRSFVPADLVFQLSICPVVGVDHEIPSDESVAVRDAIWARCARRVQEEPRCFDAVACDDDVPRLLKAPSSLTMVVDACRALGAVDLDAADHRQIADLSPPFHCSRNPGHE